MFAGELADFEQVRGLVEAEFEVEEGFVEYGVPTFFVRLRQDSKQGFLRLFERLGSAGFVPVLKRREGRVVLQVVRRPPLAPSRWIMNVVLFLVTVGTVTVTGYMLSVEWVGKGLMSNPLVGAGMFTAALMAVLGVHEMGHKLAAYKHRVEASFPFFIPGPPAPFGIGTFGAVIQQRSLAPNKDALFDLGMSGPVAGFLVAVLVTVVGVRLSLLIPLSAVPPGAEFLEMPMLFELIVTMFPPKGAGEVIWLHPVAFAGWVGMLVTMLNLVPAGMLDGGHATRGLLGRNARTALSFAGILVLIILGHYLMAMVVFFLSLQRHPGPLDDVSKLTTSRKLATVFLVLIFVLCAAPI